MTATSLAAVYENKSPAEVIDTIITEERKMRQASLLLLQVMHIGLQPVSRIIRVLWWYNTSVTNHAHTQRGGSYVANNTGYSRRARFYG
jgi:hypothetical protein